MIEGEDKIRSDLVALLSEDEGEPAVVQTVSTISAVTTPVNETEAGGDTNTPVPGELYVFYNVH
ncbi:MAG: hypothetical protein LUO88_03040, partial [Methanoregulaceae archaeon]|nr:hypothetical protein [Methanoregulaceae archaeon]